MEMPALTFKLLNEHIEEVLEHPSNRITLHCRAKWGIALFTLAGTLGLVLGKLLPPKPWAVALVWALLAVEIIGIILVVSAEFSTLKLTFAHQRREFAEVLDFDMPHHESLIEWLRSFSRERLQAMSEFSAFRVERYRSKMPILTGSMEKLGLLPVLAALIVQFKDMKWPPHPSLWQIVLFALLPFFYWLCMLTVTQRLRLELYDMLLKKALAKFSKSDESV